MQDSTLKGYVTQSAIGYHHAGMHEEDRSIMEKLFRDGHLLVLSNIFFVRLLIIRDVNFFTYYQKYTAFFDPTF